ncbi:putative zinc finger protein 827-like [Scophthalmus maximus]|uniref:Putative zinc finger protein 827-like n=1 Tax=Scophthalmus maximus TaxID=52904 RepID=A0A2U9B027_SCOMX|nr:putative zinc finger protein 827-like [Scophthalmus maximus]
MASDLLIRLSEATQKAQVHPGSQAEAEPQRLEVPLEVRGGQQDEPGLALSPDGPGASPEPPSLTHTPDGNTAAATDTLASELLRQLAERQEVNCPGVRVKEEEEPVEVDAMVVCDLVRDRPAAKETSSSSPEGASRHRFTITPVERDLGGNKAAAQSHPGAQLAEPRLSALKMEDSFFNGDCQSASSKTSDSVAGKFQFRVKMEEDDVSRTRMTEQLLSGAKMEDQFLFKAKLAERPFSAAKTGNRFLSGVKTENGLLPGAKLADRVLLSRAKTEEQLFFGAKMEDQCLRAVLWQDMSVNLASTLLHQLSETQTCHSRSQTTGYFYRCHVCGFETEGCGLFQSHMTGHRQWERASFSLHCCACDNSTNQEAEMRAHADTHARGDTAVGGGELLVHFQGHRQGNQYRCDRCGHLTRTANKLVEHVRVHTGERPFTCHLCPYSAKRRDSLRLHCKVKHAAAAALVNGNAAADAPGDVHTHRSNPALKNPLVLHRKRKDMETAFM